MLTQVEIKRLSILLSLIVDDDMYMLGEGGALVEAMKGQLDKGTIYQFISYSYCGGKHEVTFGISVEDCLGTLQKCFNGWVGALEDEERVRGDAHDWMVIDLDTKKVFNVHSKKVSRIELTLKD